MSGHASTASADLAAQNYLDSDNKRTLLHDSKPDHADIPSESFEESVAEIHSESKRKADAEIHSEIKRKPDAEIQSEWDEENKKMPVAEIHSEGEREPVAEIHSESEIEPVAEIHSESEREPVAEIHSESEREPVAEIHSESEIEPVEPEFSHRAIEQQNQLQKWIKKSGVLDKIKEDADDLRRSWYDVSIVTVPMFLKRTKRKAYAPQTVSLGPYHYTNTDVPSMAHHKARALRKMVTRFNTKMNLDSDSDNNKVFVQHAMRAILKLEDKIRNSYEGNIIVVGKNSLQSFERENLAWMLCLDGCFILEVLKTLGRPPANEENDPIFGENKVAASNILKDILMMENQIPLIVLLELQGLENPVDDHVKETLLELVFKGTRGLFKISGEKMEPRWLYPVQKVHHILGFLHKVIVDELADDEMPIGQGEYTISISRCIGHCLLKFQDKNEALNHEFESIPHAVELKNAGIKFLPCKGGICRITFERRSATIYLPLLSVTYGTEVLFRNLVAFEMCRPSEINYMSSYLNLMDDLIDSQKDVALLRSDGILINRIGSDKDAADLFNGLCKDVGMENMVNFFAELKKDVNAHYKNKIRVQLAEFVGDHCSSPWKVFASLVAVFILCLTLLQTIFTIKK